MCFLNMCKNVRKSNLCETGGVCVYYLCRLLCCLIIDKIILTPFLKELCFRILTFFNSMTKNSQKKNKFRFLLYWYYVYFLLVKIMVLY